MCVLIVWARTDFLLVLITLFICGIFDKETFGIMSICTLCHNQSHIKGWQHHDPRFVSENRELCFLSNYQFIKCCYHRLHASIQFAVSTAWRRQLRMQTRLYYHLKSQCRMNIHMVRTLLEIFCQHYRIISLLYTGSKIAILHSMRMEYFDYICGSLYIHHYMPHLKLGFGLHNEFQRSGRSWK